MPIRPGMLGRLLVAVLIATGLTAVAVEAPARAASNPVVVENQQPGTSAWQITNPSDDVRKQVKGYASATSVNLGQSVTFYVTVNPAQTYSIDVYRVGYYQGLGGRLMQHVNPAAGVKQPNCPMNAATGMISCNWTAGYTLAVPTTWTSGVYLAKLTNARGFENYITFVVRDDARPSALLYQQSVTTYQAYNNYPADVATGATLPTTGKGLYDFNSSSVKTGVGTTRAVKVSFNRPYSADIGHGDGSGEFTERESYFVRWMEQKGSDVTYSTDVDTDLNGDRLLNHNGFLSVGHDEYWSKAMFDAAVNARDHGVGLGFFGGNSVYQQIRFEAAGGQPDRVIVCYKDAALDPVKDATTTMRWRDPQVNRPEQLLMGAMWSAQQPNNVPPVTFVAKNTSHWMYAGTGVSDDQAIAPIVGYETDRYQSAFPSPATTAGSYVSLSHSPYTGMNGPDYQESMIYQAPSGAWVFDAGSIYWSWGLYNDDFQSSADPRIQAMTANFLDRIAAGAPSVPAAPSGLVARPGAGSVSLSWTNNASSATGVRLERSSSSTFGTVTTVSLPASATGYADTGLSPGAYYYRVYAVNDGGPSPSVTASAATVSYTALVDGRADLVAHWRLGEAGGDTTAWDATGAYNGNYGAGTTLGAAGAISGDPDRAVGFDGSAGVVTVPALPTAAGDFTVEGWTYLTDATRANNTVYGADGTVRILARPGSPGDGTTAYAGVWLAGTEYALQPATTLSNVNTWVHWVLTRQGGTLTLYRNGVVVGQRTDLPATATANLGGSIGSQPFGAFPLAGSIDEVAVYTGARSATEVATDYVAGVNGLAPSATPGSSVSYRSAVQGEAGLLDYWRLGETSGATAADSKGSAAGTYGDVTLGQTPTGLANDPDPAAGFNGTTSAVTLPAGLPTAAGDFTVEGWTYLTDATRANNTLYGADGTVRILARPGSPGDGTTAYAGVWLAGTEYALQPATTLSNLNTWVHWVLTRQGGTLTLYRNGVIVGQRTDLPATATANLNGSIGSQPFGAFPLAGNIDEVAVYNRALPATAVSTHYKAARYGPAPES